MSESIMDNKVIEEFLKSVPIDSLASEMETVEKLSMITCSEYHTRKCDCPASDMKSAATEAINALIKIAQGKDNG